MNAAARALFIIALLLLASAAAAPAQSTSKGTGSITGRVTGGDGRGVQGIALALMPDDYTPDRKPAARATTDADGRYRLTNVPAGRFHLVTLAPAFTNSGGKAINITAGETIENVDLTLVRGSVITGRVTDAATDKPVIAEDVFITPADENIHTRGYFSRYETDDRGIYRVFGLPSGRYLVSVGQAKDSGMISFGIVGPRHTRTFYPGVTDEAQAKIVEVSPGSEATGIDIALAAPAKTYEASGRMLDAETGKPVSDLGYGYGALNGDMKHVGNYGWDGSVTDANGEFRITNLLPGHYAAFAISRGQVNNYSDAVPFEITDGNVSGLVVKVHRGSSISGVVILEGTTDRSPLAKLTQSKGLNAQITPNEKSSELQAPANSAVGINPDGSFSITGLHPGKAHLMLGGYPPPKGFTLLRVEREGVDLRDGIEIKAGDQVSGIRVHIGYGTSTVHGQIEVRDGGQPAALPVGARLTVSVRKIGAPASPWGERPVEVDGRGRFILDGLIGGEYELRLRGWVIGGAPGAPPTTYLPTLTQTINVNDTGETTVTLIYDLGSKPQETSP